AGYGGPGIGIKLGGSGDVTATHQAWRNESHPQIIGSGVAVGDHVYVPYDNGRIECLDPKTGKKVWRESGKGALWGSITLAGENAYVTDQRGKTIVFKPSPEKLDIVSVNDLGEGCNATPAISDGQIFIRTFKGLYCIGE